MVHHAYGILDFLGEVFKELGVKNPQLRAFLFVALIDGISLDINILERDLQVDLEKLKREILKIFT